jgi:hypothetical protein
MALHEQAVKCELIYGVVFKSSLIVDSLEIAQKLKERCAKDNIFVEINSSS